MANPNQCYLPASRCFGTGPDTIYILQKVATRMQATPFYFDYQNTCYSVDPTTTAVQPGAGVSYVTGSPSGPYSTCTNCSSGCYLAPPDISFCPGTAGNQTINATMATPNGAWSASVTCSVSADVTVSPSSGTSDASGNFSFTVNYSGADSNTQTCTINVAMAGCSNGAVDVDISPVPSSCPSGLATKYNIGGGPVTHAPAPNSSGSYAVAPCDAACVSGDAVPTWDGSLTLNPGYGTDCYGEPLTQCVWGFCNCAPGGGVNVAYCWSGYLFAIGPSPQSCLNAFVAGLFINATTGLWELEIGVVTIDSGGNCYFVTPQAVYTKACGSTPKGIYVADSSYTQPQTLYIH